MPNQRGSDGSKDSGAGDAKPANQRFGKYDIVRVLGKGGMGKVYLAVDRELKRTVAIKFLSKQKAENPLLVQRFKAEGQAAANLNHENIIRVFDSGDHKGQLFLALEYVDGKDAHQMLSSRGRFPVSRSIEIIKKVALGLEHAAKHGIVHRDIKPSNIMIRKDGEIKLADLGLARSLEETEDAGITRAGTTVGTVDYMSPEQARDSKSADLRSDIYSLGATWYQLITGQPPFPDGDLTNKLRAHATARRPDPSELNDTISESVSAVIARMMAIKPEDRYASIEELLSDLDAIKGNRNAVLSAVLGDLGDSYAPGDIDLPDEMDAEGRGSESEYEEYASGDLEIDDDVPSRSKSRSKRRPPVVDDTASESAGNKKRKRRAPHDEDGADTATNNRRKKRDRQSADPQSGELPKKQRSLPPRSADDGPRESRKLDPDLIRNILIGGAILSVFGGIVWFISSQPGGASTANTAVGNPYAANQSSALVEKVKGAEESIGTVGEDASSEVESNAPPTANAAAASSGLSPEDEAAIAKLPPLAPQKGVEFPDWVGPARLALTDFKTANTFHVRDGANSRDDYVSLQKAVDSIPTSGGTVVLHGPGPHRLNRVEIRGNALVAFVAAPDGARPVIEVVGDGEYATVIDAAQSNLLFSGVDIICRSTARCETPRKWIGVDAGALTVHNSSLTDVSGEKGATAIEVSSGRVSAAVNRRFPGRVLITDTSIRGPRTTSLGLRTSICDVVIGNSFFDAGTEPAITFATAPAAQVRPTGRDGVTRREVLIAGTTVFTSAPFLRVEQTKGITSPQINFNARQCLIACSPGAAKVSAVELANWPEENSRPANLAIDLAASTLANWSSLASWTSDVSKSARAETPAAWRKWFSDHPVQANQLSDAALEPPLQPETPADIDEYPARFRKAIAARVGASLLQADVERIAWPTSGYADRTAARAAWPAPSDPRAPVVPVDVSEQIFDLAKGKLLGRFLASEAVADGTTVKVIGDGTIDLSGVEIGSRRVRVVCDQSSGGITFRLRLNKRASRPAFIVSGGQLELVEAVLELPGQAGSNLPESLIQVDGGTVALRRCRLVDAAPDRDGTAVVRATNTNSRVIASDSWLVGPGAIAAGSEGLQLTATNCALFPGRSVTSGPVTALLDHCSVRSGGSIAEAGTSTAVAIWAERSIFAPADAVVSAADAAVLRSVDWYGFENVFANGVSATARSDTPGPALTEASWPKAWPSGRITRPRVGSVGELGIGKAPQELVRADLEVPDGGVTAPVSDNLAPGVRPSDVGPSISSKSTMPKKPVRPAAPALPF